MVQGTTRAPDSTGPSASLDCARRVLTTKNAPKLPRGATTRAGMGCPGTPIHEPQLTAGCLNLKPQTGAGPIAKRSSITVPKLLTHSEPDAAFLWDRMASPRSSVRDEYNVEVPRCMVAGH